MLHSILGVFLALAWTGFAVWAMLGFWRRLRQYGPRAAFGAFARRQFLIPLLLITTLSVIRLGIVFIYPTQIGVVVSLLSSEGIREQRLDSGLHWVWPLAEKVTLYPRYWQTYTMSDRPFEGQHVDSDGIVARTKDNQELVMDVSVIYRIDPERAVSVHRYWQDRYEEAMLRPTVRGIIRHEVARFTVSEVNSEKRTELSDHLQQELIAAAGDNGFIVHRLLLRNIAFTSEYASAVEEKQVALENQQRALHEAQQIEKLAQGKANRIKILADAEADALRIKARARAEARLIQAEAEARALNLVAGALKDKQNLLTYRYITQLSPNVQAVVLPNNMPLIFPLPDTRLPPNPPAPNPAELLPSPVQAGDEAAPGTYRSAARAGGRSAGGDL